MASGIEPRCTGHVLAWAMTRPEASHSAAEKSMLEATICEWAVRRMVIAISSDSPDTALRNTSNVAASRMGCGLMTIPWWQWSSG